MKKKRRLSEETVEQKEQRRRREAMRQAKRRAAETPEQKRLRRQRDAERKAKQRQNNRLRKSYLEGFELHMGALSLLPKTPVAKYSKKDPESEHTSDAFFQCHICKLFIYGKCYICVQCTDMYMCASCELRDLHAHHYMLRVPALRSYEEVLSVLEKLRCDILIDDTNLLLEDGCVNPYSLNTCESEEIVEVECDPTHIEHLESGITPVPSEDTDSSQNTWDIVKNMDLEGDNERIGGHIKMKDRNIPVVKLKKRKHEIKDSQNMECFDHRVTIDKDTPRKSTWNNNPPKSEPKEKCNVNYQDNNQTNRSTLDIIENNKTIINQSKPKKTKKRLKDIFQKTSKHDDAIENVRKPDNNKMVNSNYAQLDTAKNILSNG